MPGEWPGVFDDHLQVPFFGGGAGDGGGRCSIAMPVTGQAPTALVTALEGPGLGKGTTLWPLALVVFACLAYQLLALRRIDPRVPEGLEDPKSKTQIYMCISLFCPVKLRRFNGIINYKRTILKSQHSTRNH